MKQRLTQDPVAVLVLLLGFTYLFCISFLHNVRADNNGVTIAVIGFMTLILNYLYGSSKGSAKKDDTIAGVINENTPVVNKAETVNVTN